MTRKAARTLYKMLVQEESMPEADADAGDGDFAGIADRVVDRLVELGEKLNTQLETARRQGDVALSRALTDVLRRVNLLIISVNQELVEFLDNAPDVARAKAQIEEVSAQLDKEAEDTAKTAADLKKTAAVLDGLAKLAGLL